MIGSQLNKRTACIIRNALLMKLKKTRYLSIHFDTPIMPYDIRKFRAAVIEKSKRQSDLFHNHKPNGKSIYRYPLIQYKVIDKRPLILCLNEATNDIHYFLENRDFKLPIGKKQVDFAIEDIHLKFFPFQTWENEYRYNILNYLPFNSEYYKEFQEIEYELDRVKFIQGRLFNHIFGTVKQLELPMPVDLRVNIEKIKGSKYIEHKGVFHQAYHINFRANLSLPNYIGIGKGSSVGFGIVKKLSEKLQ